ncbi:ZIP family metal transporter [Psychroflexus sp. CAK57W]|uniref:ZIP family metal transporter n=2 Tax=Psychroflexus curvus TaxID=2873595 RepID=UPI001CCF88DC|nr:ZIP family metal transporter [Psychroflexus curvus]MBZ9787582.1 ZIP family metal transporter [Psychroflexus curvus]
MFDETVFRVFLYALITAITTGFGAIPFFFAKKMPKKWLGWSGGVASGIMLAASFRLINEGINYDLYKTISGVLIGLVFILLSQKWLSSHENLHVGKLKGANAKKALMIIGVMTIHSFAEGVGVGVSFGGEEGFGVFMSVAIAIHNIPEGLAISLVLIPKGMSTWKAAGWSVVSSLPQPLLAIPAFLFVSAFKSFLPVGLGLAAGAMIWMVFSDLVPDALENAKKQHVATIATVSIALMMLFQVLME